MARSGSNKSCNADLVNATIDFSFPDHPPSAEKYSLHPSVRDTLRDYQWELAVPGLSGQNYIVCAPTGSGKTLVAALVISEHLKEMKGRARVLFVVNKVPLASQQRDRLQETINGAKVQEVVGESSKLAAGPANGYLSSTDESSGSDDEGKKFDSTRNDIIVCTAGCLKNVLLHRRVNFSAFSLMIIDECHNTRKNSDYAKIMQIYIKEKQSKKDLPQVIGLTATPGAGDAASPSLDTVLDHLVSLCAATDAQGGIKTVDKNKSELQSFQHSPGNSQCVVDGRREDECFIVTVTMVMAKLEETYKLRPPSGNKWKAEYVCWVNQEIGKYQQKDCKRNTLSILKTLRCLCNTLSTYYDLRYEDAVAVLQKHVMPNDGATDCEQSLSHIINQLQQKLASLEKVNNPLLARLEAPLKKQFESVPKSKAIIFVETKLQAAGICAWLSSSPSLQHIKPAVVTGKAKVSGKVMTVAEQTSILDGFRGDDFNVLVSTSVLEEGIDVPACNLVVRYQRVSSEIAEVQSRGRARASHSHSFTIVSSNSGKQYQQLMNEQKNALVEQALELMPVGETLSDLLPSKQESILNRLEEQETMLKEKKLQYSPYEVEVQCNNCSVHLCNASDIHTLSGTSHHVVIPRDFVTSKLLVKDHHKPTSMKYDMSKTHKIYCRVCEQDLGMLGRWWKDRRDYPVLKCCSLKFKAQGDTKTYKKWKSAPFEITRV